MQAAPFLAAVLLLVAAPACHPDACVWDVVRVRSEATVAVTRDGAPLAIGPNTTAGASASRDSRTDVVTTYLSYGVTVDGDPDLDRIVLSIELAGPVAPATLPLADVDASLRLVADGSVLDEGPARAGVLTLPNLATPCEHSDAYDGSSGRWVCSTDIDAAVDIPFSVGGAAYRVVAQVSQRETMDVTCHECGGIEGCDY